MKILNSSIVGAIGAVVFVAAITIIGELNAPLKTALAEAFGHHWVGKGVLSVGVFAALTLFWRLLRPDDDPKKTPFLITQLFWVGIAGGFLLTGFFIFH